VNVFVIYLLLLKATLTSFSGMASLPMVRNDFVVQRHALTDRQLNTAVVAGRSGPGPYGLYLVSVGYFADGLPGAFAGFMAVMTPAFLVIPLMNWMSTRATSPRIKSAIRAVVLSSAGLLMSVALPLARDAIHGALTLVIVLASFAILSFTRIDSLWVMLGATVVGVAARLAGTGWS
jgi:chromate transporter